jgi:amino acid adenylation domain-containing protein
MKKPGHNLARKPATTMSDLSNIMPNLPPEQQALRAKCFHSTGTFIEFTKAEIEQPIPKRFETIASIYPDRVAIATPDQVLTYAELNRMANRVAQAILAARGDEAEPIALLFDKGIAQIASMLGVLKAGKFFVLLDTSYPKLRIEDVLRDSQARLLVTDAKHGSVGAEAGGDGPAVLGFESIDWNLSAPGVAPSVDQKALALIAYTSGSTGRPKGVVWDHRNLMHMVHQCANLFHTCPQDRIALLPSGGSVQVVVIILNALLTGAALLPFAVEREGLNRLAHWLAQERISTCWISSPLFRSLCESLTGDETFPDLRVIRLGGEAAKKSDLELYRKYFLPDSLLINGLASSEAGFLRMYFLDSTTEIVGNELPVGYALEDKEILLLDEAGHALGVNEIGEIAVRSAYLFSGYWNSPELTETKLKADPEGSDNRLHLTGDLGLMLPDGCLVYKGRKDFRVRIRGHGVEIAEVEKALLEHPSIREAVVVARESDSAEARLVAYYTVTSGPGPSAGDLRRFLLGRLPGYMIPSAFMILETIPISAGGKIDRKAFPAPANSRPETIYVAPRTPREKKLAAIWRDSLDVEEIGVGDSFVDLGGQSLIAMQIITKINAAFGIEITLPLFFEALTVSKLAELVETLCWVKENAQQCSQDRTGEEETGEI